MERKKESKQDKVLRYLQTHKQGLTQRDAIEKFQAYRLSGIVFRLKRQGYNIITNMEYTENENGYMSGYARYVIV